MKLFRNIRKGIREMRVRNSEKAFQELLNSTDQIEERIASALDRKEGDEKESLEEYYKTLEIKRTADRRIIRSAYVRLIKKHHPDISKEKESEEIAKKINEAYHVLSKKSIGKRFEELFVGGAMNPSFKIGPANDLLKAYAKRRDEDFEIMQGQMDPSADMNAIVAAVGDFTDWKRRPGKIAKETFRDFYKVEGQLKRPEKRNAKLYSLETDAGKRAILERNAAKLESARKIYVKLLKGTDAVISSVRETIEPEERQVAKGMDDWIAFVKGLSGA